MLKIILKGQMYCQVGDRGVSSTLSMVHCCHRGRGSVTSPGTRGVLVPSDAGQLDERRHQPDARAPRRERRGLLEQGLSYYIR